jgi:hypothetical protein
MRLELGTVNVVLDADEDPAVFLKRLYRHLTNLEVGEILGVSNKTVQRWKREGRLPSRGTGQIMLLDLLHFLDPGWAAGTRPRGKGTLGAARAREETALAGQRRDAGREEERTTARGCRSPRSPRPRVARSSGRE